MIWDDSGLTVIFGASHFHLSQGTVLALLTGAAILLSMGFLYLRFAAERNGLACRWKRARNHRSRPPFCKWRCGTCGVEAYSSDNRPPKECKKGLERAM